MKKLSIYAKLNKEKSIHSKEFLNIMAFFKIKMKPQSNYQKYSKANIFHINLIIEKH